MFGLAGVLVRILLFRGLRYAITSGRGQGSNAVAQGMGLIIVGCVAALGGFFLLSPLVFSSLYTFLMAGALVLALVGGGIGRIVIGLFAFSDNVESRSGPAASPVNYYVALPEEMPLGYCWQCGRRVKIDSLICLRCGATQPKGAQQRAMMSAPTFNRGGDSGQWPQWQQEEDPLQRLGPGPMGSGQFPGGGPHPPGPGAPYPGGGPYHPSYPPPQMPPRGPGRPAFPLPSRPMSSPRGGAYPGAPYPPDQQQPPRGRPPRGMPPRERPPRGMPPSARPPREKKPSRPRWGR